MLDVEPPELGHVLNGKTPGRTSDEQITICDLTGTGAQDTAIANVALKRSPRGRCRNTVCTMKIDLNKHCAAKTTEFC